jgi:predicted RNA polymerase sigma factor
LGRTQEAKADFQKALKLAEQTGNYDLKTGIEQSLQELDNIQEKTE